jgi:hypothetical protein
VALQLANLSASCAVVCLPQPWMSVTFVCPYDELRAMCPHCSRYRARAVMFACVCGMCERLRHDQL